MLPTLFALAVVGLLPGPGGPRRAVPPWLPVVLAAGLFVVAQGFLKASYDTTDRIHQAALGVLCAPLAARGLVRLAGWASRASGRPGRAVLGGLTLVTLLAGPLPKALEVVKPQGVVERAVGRWLRAEAAPSVLAGHETRAVAWHAGARFVPLPAGSPEQVVATLRRDGVEWVAIYTRTRASPRGGLADRLAQAGATLAHAPWSWEHEGRIYTWWLFRLDPC